MQEQPQPLWAPSPARINASRMSDYMRWLGREKQIKVESYEALWQWSVDELPAFWESIWQYFDIQSSAPYTHVLDGMNMPCARWFEGSRLNITEQVFRFHCGGDEGEKPAIIGKSELRPTVQLSWNGLREQVGSVANALRAMGVRPGDRMVSYLPNIPETAVAFYACASIGAIWSSCSPDMGTPSVLDRFGQIAPKVLLAVDGYRYGGKDFDRLDVVKGLMQSLDSLEHVVLLPYLDRNARLEGAHSWEELLAYDSTMQFEHLAFDHPLWVVYSSGTTGMPKPIVHGQGGVLLESLKGHGLHTGLGEQDRFMWFSTTGWIMWNSQVTGLLLGATIAIYDGNPGYPDLGTLWKFAEEAELTVFGAGAAYFANCMKAGIAPRKLARLNRLHTVGSTGSPLPAEAFTWVYEQLGPDILLASISGGTDVVAAPGP